MIDLEKEREAFFYELNGRGYEFENKTWIHGLGDVGGLFDDDQLNMVWEMYLAGQESKQAEIDSLKAQLRELNDTVQHLKTESSGVHAALREQQRTNEYLLEKLFGVDAGEYVVVPKEPTFQMKQAAYKQYDTGLISITEIYQAMIEAAQENSNE